MERIIRWNHSAGSQGLAAAREGWRPRNNPQKGCNASLSHSQTQPKFSSPKKCFKFLTCIRRTKTGNPYLLWSRLTLHPPIPIGFLLSRHLLVTGRNMILSQRNTMSFRPHDFVLGQMIYFFWYATENWYMEWELLIYLAAWSSSVSTKKCLERTILWKAKKRRSAIPTRFIFSWYATEKTDTVHQY